MAERHGYGVVREFVGHGVGRVFHAAPHVMHCRNGEPGVMQVPSTMLLVDASTPASSPLAAG